MDDIGSRVPRSLSFPTVPSILAIRPLHRTGGPSKGPMSSRPLRAGDAALVRGLAAPIRGALTDGRAAAGEGMGLGGPAVVGERFEDGAKAFVRHDVGGAGAEAYHRGVAVEPKEVVVIGDRGLSI